MATRQSTIRAPERTWEQIAELAEKFGTQTAAIIVAVDRLYQAERSSEMDYRMTTEDRAAQVHWLDEFAWNLISGPGNYDNPVAEHIVTYALDNPEARVSWGIELPGWFDEHDREYLIARVTYLLE